MSVDAPDPLETEVKQGLGAQLARPQRSRQIRCGLPPELRHCLLPIVPATGRCRPAGEGSPRPAASTASAIT
jgi:hypothetical protein